ncbi:MAG: ROK family protein [Opitutaceae bacterium]|nr:ROK family protein [Opitutaceae bacterium]
MIVLACDLGGTRIKVGVVRDGRVLAQTVEEARSNLGLARQLPMLKSAWMRLLERLQLRMGECSGVSMAFPSLVDAANARVLAEYGKYADAMELDLREWARVELGLPLVLENDARMALVGEWRAGAGRGSNDLVMITLGTGLGTCAVIEGRLLRGRHGQAGILGGHSTLNIDGGNCRCGNVGCAENEASTAMLRRRAESLPGWARSALAQAPVLDYAQVFAYASVGDTCAVALRDHSLRVWSALAVNLVHAYDPEALIIGGGIMASGEVILPVVSEYIRQHASTPWGSVRVVASTLGDQAALVAGDWLLQEQFPHLRL